MPTLMQLKPGDILAYPPNPDLFATGIALGELLAGENPTFVHVGIWAGDGEISAYGNGVQLSVKFPWPCRVLRPTMVDRDSLDRGLVWLRSKVGKTPYSYWGLLWVWVLKRLGLHRVVELPDGVVFCSQLAAAFLTKCGLNAFPGNFASEIMPCDFSDAWGLVDLGPFLPDGE